MSAPTGVRTVEAQRVYAGAYTSESRPGSVTSYDLDGRTGELKLLDTVEAESSSFLAVHPTGSVIYAVREGDQGAVISYTVSGDGRLSRTGPPRETGGAGPCHLSVAPGGRWLIVANYGSGSVAVLPIDPDGWLPGDRTDLTQHQGDGPDLTRQEHAHAHNVRFAPSGEHVYAVDLGTDTIYTYALDGSKGRLEPVETHRAPAGAGPRHIAFDNADHAFVCNELASTVTAYDVNPKTGALQEKQTIAAVKGSYATDGPKRNYPAEIAVTEDGRFVYVSNRGTDVITVFAVDGEGVLSPVADFGCGGENPRGFVIVSGQLLVANQVSGNIAVFDLDPQTGLAEPVGQPVGQSGVACVVPA